MKQNLADRLMALESRGFDQCEPRSGNVISVGCGQCEVLVINGFATHESGCPNLTHECKGCNARLNIRSVWCEDCNPSRSECGLSWEAE